VFAIAYGCILAINLTALSMEWDEATHFTGGLLLSRGQFGTWVTTNSLYPPIYDLFVTFYYLIIGPSVFAARLVATTFSVLSLFVIYEIASRLYDKRTALVSVLMFSVMPGIIWLSRLAMIETMLIFMFCVSMLFFFSWLRTNRERDRVFSIVAFAIGVVVKYQVLVVVPIIMLLGMFFWKRDYLKTLLKSCLRLPRIAVVAAVIGVAAIILYELSASGLLSLLLFTIREGTAQAAFYSSQYPMPIFYLVEMTWFNNVVQPISLILYAIALAGLGLMVYRRKREDKFLLLWFIVVYAVFTLIPNKDWRYVTIAFPVLAISASTLLVAAFDKLLKIGRTAGQTLTKKFGSKIIAGLLVALVATGVFISCVNAYNWQVQNDFKVPVEQATYYAAKNLNQNQSVVVVCAVNSFNEYMVWYYMYLKNPRQNYNQILQYPELAADAYPPDFNVSQFVNLCQQHNVKYVLIYEFGDLQYFSSTLTEQEVCSSLNQTGQFTLQATFGNQPNRIFVYSYSQQK
jgi:4-amino-4-deoxy-L-arabinose transferase-like glycosyltransferase